MFDFNGKEILLKIAREGGFESKSALIAGNTLFVHPQTVKLTNNKNLFQIIRDFPNRGKIISSLMCCDNTGPQHAIEWSIGGMKKKDIQINHIYSESKNVEIYTALPNLCATPTFIAKLTDTDDEIKNLLKFHSYHLYGFTYGETPVKPEGYDDLSWMEMRNPIDDLELFLRQRMRKCRKSRTAVSAREIGWYFSDYQPDKAV